MWLLPATIYFITISLFTLLYLQKKYKWNGFFLYISFYLYIVPFFYFLFSWTWGPYYMDVISLIGLVALSILIIYWIDRKKATNTILIFGIHRKNCAEYLSRLTQNLGFSNTDILPLRHWKNTKFFNRTGPAFKVSSKDAFHYFKIQFGYFTRIDIFETTYGIGGTQSKSFKDTCWMSFEELSDNRPFAPYIIGLLSMLALAAIIILFNFFGIFSYFDVTSYLFILALPELALNNLLLIPYGMRMDEILPN